MSSSPSLLSIPLELRWEIFEYALASYFHDGLFVHYREGAIETIPSAVNLCHQIRYELLPLCFRHKTVSFWTIGELGAALLNRTSTIPYWKNIHIMWTGRRCLTSEGKRWHIEPGLEVLNHIPNMNRLRLDIEQIKCYDHTDVETEISHAIDQIIEAPVLAYHLTLTILEVTGTMSEPLSCKLSSQFRETVFMGDFRRVYARGNSGHWNLKESSTVAWVPSVGMNH